MTTVGGCQRANKTALCTDQNIYFIIPVSEMAQRRHLCSAAGHQLVVPSQLMWPSGVLCTRSETMKLFA